MDDLMFQEQDLPKGIDGRLWRRIFGHARPYLGSMIGLGASGVGMAAMDTLMPLITGFMIDAIIQGSTDVMAWWGAYMAVIFISCFIVWYFIMLAGRVSTGVAYDLRTESFSRLKRSSWRPTPNYPSAIGCAHASCRREWPLAKAADSTPSSIAARPVPSHRNLG